MSEHVREPTLGGFLDWCRNNWDLAEEFYDDCILPNILELEQDDYFGTEGFNKRYGGF